MRCLLGYRRRDRSHATAAGRQTKSRNNDISVVKQIHARFAEIDRNRDGPLSEEDAKRFFSQLTQASTVTE